MYVGDIPCPRDCPNRSPECHGTCKHYTEWKANRERVLHENWKQRQVIQSIIVANDRQYYKRLKDYRLAHLYKSRNGFLK